MLNLQFTCIYLLLSFWMFTTHFFWLYSIFYVCFFCFPTSFLLRTQNKKQFFYIPQITVLQNCPNELKKISFLHDNNFQFHKKNCEFLQLKLIPTTEIVTWLVDFQGIHFRKKSFLNLTTNFLWWCRMHKDIILPIKHEKYVIYQFSCFITLQLKLLRGT